MVPLCTGRRKTGEQSEENPDLLSVLEGQKIEGYLASYSWIEPHTHSVRAIDGEVTVQQPGNTFSKSSYHPFLL